MDNKPAVIALVVAIAIGAAFALNKCDFSKIDIKPTPVFNEKGNQS